MSGRLDGIVEPVPIGADDWYTPPLVFDALGLRFDCDPASPEGGVPWIPVEHFHTETEDGLSVPWHGLVWLNPPYSAPAPWLHRLRDHGEGVALVPNDSSTAWWHDTVPRAGAVCFMAGRIRFIGGTDLLTPEQKARSTSARFPTILIGFGERASAAVRNCGLGWTP